MSKQKIIKFFFLLLLTLIIATIAKTQLKLDYENTKLEAQIIFFNTDKMAVADRKLYSLPFYANISSYFNSKNIGERINRKLNNSQICNRNFHAKKRNPKILIEQYTIDISLIFTNEKNARKCSIEISEYVKAQEDYFILEIEKILTNLTDSKKYIDFDILKLGEIQSGFLNNNDIIENIQEIMNLLNLRQLSQQKVELKKFVEEFDILKNGNIIKYTSKIEIGDKNILGFEIEYLTILILIFLSLIFYRKEIDYYFNKVKKKI